MARFAPILPKQEASTRRFYLMCGATLLLLGATVKTVPAAEPEVAGVESATAVTTKVDELLASKQFEEAAYRAGAVDDDQLRDELLTRVAQGQLGAKGGGTQADFETLIELMTTTIDPESWEENGGPGAAEGFPGGVYVDPQGLLQKVTTARTNKNQVPSGRIDDERVAVRARAALDSGNRDQQASAELRKVSLTRLERALQLNRVLGKPIDDNLRYLAGIHRLQYLFIYPESGDLVIAGPAGPWHRDPEGRPINDATREPVLQLDDLVVMLRNAYAADGRFTCSITPIAENLQATQTFLDASRDKPLAAGTRNKWLADLRSQVGRQTIEITGIDARTRAAKVIVEADYRMKLIGMGLEAGVPGVVSYLDLVDFNAQGELPEMQVLRWWFTLDDKSVTTNDERDVFEFSGQGVVVLSENELLTRLGQRVHTGRAEVWNQQFARSFTDHFAELASKYPVYADLRNLFDLALIAGLVRHEDLPNRVNWQMTYFGDLRTGKGLKHSVEGQFVPREVETVINHRTIDRRNFVAGVSGGVSVDSGRWTQGEAITAGDSRTLKNQHQAASPKEIPSDIWWWD